MVLGFQARHLTLLQIKQRTGKIKAVHEYILLIYMLRKQKKSKNTIATVKRCYINVKKETHSTQE